MSFLVFLQQLHKHSHGNVHCQYGGPGAPLKLCWRNLRSACQKDEQFVFSRVWGMCKLLIHLCDELTHIFHRVVRSYKTVLAHRLFEQFLQLASVVRQLGCFALLLKDGGVGTKSTLSREFNPPESTTRVALF